MPASRLLAVMAGIAVHACVQTFRSRGWFACGEGEQHTGGSWWSGEGKHFGTLATPSETVTNNSSPPQHHHLLQQHDANAQLRQWIELGGGSVTGVEHRPDWARGGGGLVFTENAERVAEQAEVLLTIPCNFWFTEVTVRRSSGMAGLIHSDPLVGKALQRGQDWSLIVALDYERHNPWSPWKPYLSTLPAKPSPIVWDDAVIAELESPALIGSIGELRVSVAQVHSALYPHLTSNYPLMFPAKRHSLQSLWWAASAVWSRAFDISQIGSVDQKPVWGMIPMVDMINHKIGAGNNYSMDEAIFRLRSAQRRGGLSNLKGDNNKGEEEVFISYGDQKTTFEFFLFYGFLPDEHDAGDHIVLHYLGGDSSGAAALHNKRSATQGGHAEPFTCVVGHDGRVPLQFLDAVQKRTPGNDLVTAWRWIKEAVDAASLSFSTTLAEDEQKLKRWLELAGGHGAVTSDLGPSFESVVVVQVRIRIKRILSAVASTAHHQLLVLAGTTNPKRNPQLKATLKAHKLSGSEAARQALFEVVLIK